MRVKDGTLERMQSDLTLHPLILGMTMINRRASEKEGFLSVDVNFWVPKGWRLEVGKPVPAPRFTCSEHFLRTQKPEVPDPNL